MQVIYNLKDRKPFVKALEEITGAKSVYKKPPTFAFEVGYFIITREGNLECSDGEDMHEVANVLRKLEERGYVAESNDGLKEQQVSTNRMQNNLNVTVDETTQSEAKVEEAGLSVAMPRVYFTDEALENLKNLVASKQSLIKKALGIQELPIQETHEKISFPWFEIKPTDRDAVAAYTHFIYALCEMANSQKRISATEKEVENERYAFRCFLLRLGFIGDKYKTDRKILLQNLEGSAAFKNKKGA